MDGHEYTASFEAPGGKPILKAYPDPLTKADPWTIGLGCTGPDVREGVEWTEAQCWSEFYNRYAVASAGAARDIGSNCWSTLSDQRRAVLTDMAFQMGEGGLGAFQNMLASVRASNWPLASHHMLDSAYAKQTPSRAKANALTMETGEWPDERHGQYPTS